MITYSDSLDSIAENMLQGFFVGWPNPPSPETHLRILKGSSHVVLAIDSSQVVGFITALSDRVLSAYIPLLEVLPHYQRRGIGTELVKRMLGKVGSLYMVDLLCDSQLVPYYSRLGFQTGTGMLRRHYANQSGLQMTDARTSSPRHE
jgi:GNAT superfamily N-acetyltransferase